MRNHVTVRGARVRGQAASGEVLATFDADDIYDVGAILTLPDGARVHVVRIDSERLERLEDGSSRVVQVLRVGRLRDAGPH